MFAKLLKHEWRATRGVVSLLCVIILIAGFTIGGILNFMLRAELQQGANVIVDTLSVVVETEESAISNVVLVLCMLLLAAGIIAIAVCCAGSLFYVIHRFYKRCFTDEGYLTFTLPVNNHQILLSSITNCILSELVTLLAAIAAGCIVAVLVLIAVNHQIVWADVWVAWADVWQQLVDFFWKNIDRFAVVGFSGIFGALSELVLLMLAVTIGALIAKKHKILAAVGVYYGIGIVESILFSTMFLSASPENADLFLASPGIMGIFLTIGGYFLMHQLISKKLNLT